MKTVLFITDCSITSAEILTHWLSNSPALVSLTVVYPYDVDPYQPLNKVTVGEVRHQALSRLQDWQNMLTTQDRGLFTTSGTPGNTVQAKILLGTPELAARIYWLLGSYDYFLENKVSDSKLRLPKKAGHGRILTLPSQERQKRIHPSAQI